MRIFTLKALLAVSLVISSGAQAQSDITVSRSGIGSGAGLYFGVAAGSTDYDEAGGDDVSVSILAGYALSDILGVELTWSDYGSSEVENTSNEAEADALMFGLIGSIPLNNEVSAFAQLGVGRWDYAFGSIDETDTDVYVGLGIDYEISHQISARFSYHYLPLDGQSGAVEIDEKLQTIQAGVIFRP